MTQTERASVIALFIAYLIGAPFITIAVPAMIRRDLVLISQIWPLGYLLVAFCSLMVLAGAWLDGLD